MYKVQIHPSADIKAECIGEGTTIWQGVVILHGAKIGKNCNICAHCLLEGDVVLGDNVTLSNQGCTFGMVPELLIMFL